MTWRGPYDFISGILKGAQVTKDWNLNQCDKLLSKTFIPDIEKASNLSAQIKLTANFYDAMLIFFDDTKVMTRMMSNLHPTLFSCWNGAETVWNHFYNIFVELNGASPKSYLINTVYNFGQIFDSFREMALFFMQDSRGQANSLQDAGYNLGLGTYLIITPNMVPYESYAVPHTIKDYDQLNDKYWTIVENARKGAN
jgi:hypothetical protein